MPDPSRENDIALKIVGSVAEDAVKQRCETRLAVYKQPSRISIRTA